MILSVVLNPCIDKTVFLPGGELPGPPPGSKITFRKASAIQMIAGGKGNNVARVLKNFGYGVRALNLVGGSEGRTVVSLLEAEGIAYTPVFIGDCTREIITVVETAGYRQIVYTGPSPSLTAAERRAAVKAYAALLPRSSLVVISGSLPDGELAGVYAEMVGLARAAGLRTILDTRDAALAQGLAAGPFAVKPNVAEAERLLDLKIDSQRQQLVALDRFSSLGIPLVILSLGEHGVLARYQGKTYRVTPPAVEGVNPIGSGDSLVAGLAMGLMDDLDIEGILKLSVAAGAANAAIWPAAGITREQVAALLPRVQVEQLPVGLPVALPDQS